MTYKQRVITIAIGILFGLLFIYTSLLVHQDFFRTIDYFTMIQLQNLIDRRFDFAFSLLTLIGSSEIIMTLITVAFMFIWLRFRKLFLGIFFFIFIFIVELMGKFLIYHPKPPDFFHRYTLQFNFPSSFFIQTDFSYPSGHMARISFISTLIVLFILIGKKTKFSKILLLLLPILIIVITFISRISLGHHWVSDVIGGLFLGISLAGLSVSFW